MNTGQKYDIAISQGVDFFLQLTINGPDGNALNLSGYSGYAPIRNRYGETGAVMGAFDVEVLSTGSGILTLTMMASGVESLYTTQGVYQLQIMDANGSKTRYIEGYLSIYPELSPW